METWGQWLRRNSDKLLCFTAWLISLAVVLHLMHHTADAANIAWGREAAGTLLGGFLGLITGAKLFAGGGSEGEQPKVGRG